MNTTTAANIAANTNIAELDIDALGTECLHNHSHWICRAEATHLAAGHLGADGQPVWLPICREEAAAIRGEAWVKVVSFDAIRHARATAEAESLR